MSLYVDIEKRYGKFHLKMKFESGDEVLALLGASGCGKSLTLKCIAGIETPDRGRIVLDGQVLFDSEKRINLPPQKRKVGYLFQQYALFPNMTVYQNIAVGMRKCGNDKKYRSSRWRASNAEHKKQEEVIDQILSTIGLEGMEQKYPHQLSGGQQQRVALARILVNEPKILLLDEPFSALDSHLRFRLEQQVREVIHSFGKSVVLVSHNRDEVFRLSDKIAVVSDGKIETMGDKHDVFRSPQTKNAAILTGCKNVSPIKIIDEGHVLATDWNMVLEVKKDIAIATENVVGNQNTTLLSDVTYVGIRMKYIRAFDNCSKSNCPSENIFRCRVTEVIENPFSYTVMLVRENEPGELPLGWEMIKSEWEKMQTEYVTICIPSKSILLLKEM